MLAALLPLVSPLKWVVYLLPFLGLSALILGDPLCAAGGYDDLATLHDLTTLLTHAITSLFAINILAVLTQAFIAQAFRASVGPLSIGLRFGFFPRFTVRIRHTEQLSRRERMWLHAGPLLMRVFLFSAGVLVWYNTRDTFATLSRAGLAIAFLCGVNILLEGGNPLVKGNGYHLLAAFMNEPYLRGKSYKAFMSKLRGGSATEADSNVLVTYALANFLYAFLVVTVIVMIVTKFLAQLQIGGATIIVALVLAGYLLVRTAQRFRQDLDRLRALGAVRPLAPARHAGRGRRDQAGRDADAAAPRSTSRTAIVISLLLLLFLPYPYEAGGNFDIYPSDRQVITTDVSGIVEEVNFVGSESVKKGTVIARIAATDLKSEINVLTREDRRAGGGDQGPAGAAEEGGGDRRRAGARRRQEAREVQPRARAADGAALQGPGDLVRGIRRGAPRLRGRRRRGRQARRRPGAGQDRRHAGQDRRREGQARFAGRGARDAERQGRAHRRCACRSTATS